MSIAFDSGQNQVVFYNRPSSDVGVSEPQSYVDFAIEKDQPISFQLVSEESVVILYLNGEKVLTTRMFQNAGQPWEIYAENCIVEIRDLRH